MQRGALLEMPTVLLTGGAGYIGSHTCVELIGSGWQVVIVDNLSNSSDKVVERIEEITGVRPRFVFADITDAAAMHRVMNEANIDAVVHFAGLKAVGESVAKPLEYYANNVGGTLVLLDAMRARGVDRMVFSSSATVYAPDQPMPLTEASALGPINPYGRTKRMIEEILTDVAGADPAWRMTLLRYFNPVGAHASGIIGEDPAGVPNNLMPYVCQVAVGRRPKLSVFGSDYPTPDGTGVRDYIHVVDLARGHVAALSRMMQPDAPALATFNLGTGRGHSVLELVHTFEKTSGRRIPYELVARRAGDAPTCYADVSRANRELRWKAERDLDAMCTDAWRWQSANPQGYGAA